MKIRLTAPTFQALAWCLHALVLALLGFIAVRAVTQVGDGSDRAGAVIATCVVTAAVYGIGPAFVAGRDDLRASALWLAAVSLCWLVLLALTADGIWIAFPLYFLYLHLLPRRAGVLAVAAAAVAAVTGYAWHRHALNVGAVIGPVLGAAVVVATVLGYQALYRESEERRRLIDELTAARAGLAAADHQAGVMSERERLAREIHDTLAQGLSSIQLLLRAAQRTEADPTRPSARYVEQARQTAQDNLAEARRFVRALAPPALEDSSLVSAIRRLCATTSERDGLPVDFHVSGEPLALPTGDEVALLRVAQSALANAVQHSHARRAGVTLSYMDTEVALDIVDDGDGFDVRDIRARPGAQDGGGFGLAAMRSRVAALGGTLTIESEPGQGTAVAVLLPTTAPTPSSSEPWSAR